MKKTFVLFAIILTIGIVSCNQIKKKTKDGINKSGEVVGKGATEFFEGVGEGVEKTLSLQINLEKPLNEIMNTGKNYVQSVSGGYNNQLTIYLIFNQDFNDTILVKAYDKEKLEIGRCKKVVTGKKDDAQYFDFPFDTRTRLESRGIISIEKL